MKGQHFPVGSGDGVQLFGKLFLQCLILRDTQQGGTCTGQAEGRTGGTHQIFDGFVIGNQVFAVVLMKPVCMAVRSSFSSPSSSAFSTSAPWEML